MGTEERKPQMLDYRGPGEARRPLRAARVIELCMPGLLCWTLYLGDMLGIRWPAIIGSGFFPLWLLAIATGIASITLFAMGRLRPITWQVALNLLVNVSGLLLSACALVSAL